MIHVRGHHEYINDVHYTRVFNINHVSELPHMNSDMPTMC